MLTNSTKVSDADLRSAIHIAYLSDEAEAVERLINGLDLKAEMLDSIHKDAVAIVKEIRQSKPLGIMETFLAEYGLSTQEGVSLMCLAEALLRVPDDSTIDALINDKIVPANWSKHLGHSTSPWVNTSTWALLLTGKIIDSKEIKKWDISGNIRQLLKRVGEPVIRTAVAKSMKILGHQFVLGRNIKEAIKRAKNMEDKGYTYSYDMLGEAAHTAHDARVYFMAYSKAITALSESCDSPNITENPGISVKLSALHPRYEFANASRILKELVPRVSSLVQLAKNANMGFNIDAEEADRLDLSLDVIEAVLSNTDLKNWEGFGVVVQAYMPRAPYVLDWLYQLAQRLDRKIMVRLVKGAYWDSEIKQAQVAGLEGYPVFTRKASTDISYLACAKKLLSMTDFIYPQFATHNANTVAAVLNMAGERSDYEFQRLHGMGEALYEVVRRQNLTRSGSTKQSRCRIYAPVGVHEDLLAYLVRRLLENGANSSFVNQVLDESVPPEDVVRDPISVIRTKKQTPNPQIPLPCNMLSNGRINSKGINISNPSVLEELNTARNAYLKHKWQAGVNNTVGNGDKRAIDNPADSFDYVGDVVEASIEQVDEALIRANNATKTWRQQPVKQRAIYLERLADFYEEHAEELIALTCREAGKLLPDSISEIREAVDFCRYYANRARRDLAPKNGIEGRGVFVCISPWNFPLAIFTGQIVAALVAGNTVIAKPAEQTPLVAAFAVNLMHKAGIPKDVIQLLPGDGATVGSRLTSSALIGGVCFTGSTNTAIAINKAMANHVKPTAPLIAETGGLNAMIVDSTALPEQVVGDIITSAFQSAGQRCSALRVLYLQVDIADKIINMLKGAMDELIVGDPWEISTDVGPVIDESARKIIIDHCEKLEKEGRLIKKIELGTNTHKGTFVSPCAYRIESIEQLDTEIFGPVLHIATFKSEDLDKVVEKINATGYGLTMGFHSRVDHRVQQVCDKAHIGNLYINRNQIGAMVGIQPFGGEGLSGTGPKAGGPHYLARFTQKLLIPNSANQEILIKNEVNEAFHKRAQQALDKAKLVQDNWNSRQDRRNVLKRMSENGSVGIKLSINSTLEASKDYFTDPLDLEGPTGESNQLSLHGRGVFICAGSHAIQFASLALLTGNATVIFDKSKEANSFAKNAINCGVQQNLVTVFPYMLSIQMLDIKSLAGIAINASSQNLSIIRQALAGRSGTIVPLLTDPADWRGFCIERAICIDTTASGGNASLLASIDSQ